MPFLEMMLHLQLTNDGVADQDENEILTDLGHRYVRSKEGRELVNTSGGIWWRWKYIWVRV